MEEIETFPEEWHKHGGAPAAAAGTGAFVPHTEGVVKTDKKISSFVAERAAAKTDRRLLFCCRQPIFFYRKWPSHGGRPVLTVPLLCVAEWTHTLASERAHTTNDYGKRRYT